MDRPVTAVLADLRCQLGEGPVWWDGVLFWVDIEGRTVFALKDGVTSPRYYPVGERVSAIVPWSGHGLLVALQTGVARLELATGALTPLVDPEPSRPDNRLNDGKCDPQGRLVIGSMHCDAEAGAGRVYCLDREFQPRCVHRGVTISNGLAWSADGGTLYYIDTPTQEVRAYAYDGATGEWSDERTVIRIPTTHGAPDGMCIDDNGNLWIALWGGWGVECWDPRTGAQIDRIEVPTAQVTCPCFGGADRDRLFVTTARIGLSREALVRQPLAGSVFSVVPGVTGPLATPFG